MADETICIYTPTGMICYENGTPQYTRRRGGEREPTVLVGHQAPPGDADVHVKVKALIDVAAAERVNGFDLDNWTVIRRHDWQNRLQPPGSQG